MLNQAQIVINFIGIAIILIPKSRLLQHAGCAASQFLPGEARVRSIAWKGIEPTSTDSKADATPHRR